MVAAANTTDGEAPIRALAAKSKALQLEDWEYSPAPLGPEDIEIEPLYNGLCHSDLHVIQGDWGEQPLPKVPGHEIVGKVTKTGPGVKHLKQGDLVGVGWHKSCCTECDLCVAGETNLCPELTTTMYGPSNGGFGERFRCHGAVALKIEDGVDPKTFGPMMCAGITVFAPLSRLVKPGSKVGVAGLGGLGHIALQFAKAMGAEVWALSGSKQKEAEARKLGAAKFCSIDDVPDMGLDVLLNTIPQGSDIPKMVQKVGANGTLCLVGEFASQINGVAVAPVILGQKSITGSTSGGQKAFREMMRMVKLHDIKPICEYFPLKDANKALEHLKDGTPKYRIVLETGDYFKSK